MSNMLLADVEYLITETPFGIWRRHLAASGAFYAEFTSRARVAGWPLVQIVRGRSPETGAIGTARALVAVGQKAVGLVAIGQAATGVVAVGQLALGLLVGIGQAATGVVAIGQAAAGVFTIGQFALGWQGVAQFGLGSTLHTAFLRR